MASNIALILAWFFVPFSHGSSYPWAEVLDDIMNEVDFEFPASLLTNLVSDFKERVNNESLNLERPFQINTRTSAKFTPDTEAIGRESNYNLYFYELMTLRYGIPKSTAIRLLRRHLSPLCQMKPKFCNPVTPFRSIDGSCNNIQHPYWGASFTTFDRMLPADYADGFNEPRGGLSSVTLPNPRLISTTIHYDVISPDLSITNMVPQFGQFVDHDMTLAPEGDKHCCTKDLGDKDCWPIKIPSNDPFFSKVSSPQTCMDFTRSTPFCFPAGTGIREQFNILTAFLDASQVYGSDAERAEQLRAFNGGRLAVNTNNVWLLPTVAQVEERTNKKIPFMGKYLAGDERVNEMPALTTMHTLLVREHNRIAGEVQQVRPQWSDDEVFENARRILIAEWQNVVYGEYLPVILGDATMIAFDLNLGEDHTLYNPMLNPTIFHAFATAAYRFGHTLINGIIQLYKGLAKVGSYPLKDNFFESEQLDQNNGDGYNLILGGLMVQNAQTYDPHVTEALTNFVLKPRAAEFGSDLIARNVQRGREHGIQPYTAYRQICQLSPLTTWNNRPAEIIPQTWSLLRGLYKSPRDIDLFTGGMSEVPVHGGYSGATFNCLKAMQFYRSKYGDRYFFTHGNQAGSFSRAQIQHIRKRTLSDIMCENSDLDMATVNVFRVPSANNPQVYCNDESRTKLDVELLLEKVQQ
ncbi:Peroxidasin [Orchesella cincta]|uniref:Peroxidasin n=1 Tax=Orchesella cincta TaxID=48709 RepID=A0A1D2MN13_ORCCI|nr:Peroxidasin [Orchesella cincta]